MFIAEYDLAELDTAAWDAIIGVNLSGGFHTMRLALRKLGEKGFGRVVNFDSVRGIVASVAKVSALIGVSLDGVGLVFG